MQGFLPFRIEPSADGTREVQAQNGMWFKLTGEEPPLIAVRTTFDNEHVPIVQLLGRNDPREQWSVLREVRRCEASPARPLSAQRQTLRLRQAE